MASENSQASGSRDNVGSQPTQGQKEPGLSSGKGLPWNWSKKRSPIKKKKEHDNIAHDIFDHSIDETDMPYMLLSVIGDSPEFQPKEWSKLSFETAILETINRAEECLVMYVRPGLGNTIGTLLENTLKTNSIENDRFLTYRCIRTEKDTILNSNDTGLCLYSHKHMAVCDLRKSGDKPNMETRSETMIQLEEYIHGFTIRIDFVEEVDNVPVVLVLAEGDMTSVNHVSRAVQKKTAVYIIQGSGKAADVIADYLQAAHYSRESSLRQTVARNFGFAFLKDENEVKCEELRGDLEIIIQHKEMITIFDIEREEPKTLADMISDSVSSFWTISSKKFEDGYIWIPKIYLPLAYRYIQFHREFESQKASRAFNVSTNIVRRLLEDGTSLRKIYEHDDTYVYFPTWKKGHVKAVVNEDDKKPTNNKQIASNPRREDQVNIFRRRLQYLRDYCRELVGYNTGAELFSRTSPEIVSKGYMTEEQLAELFMFEFTLSGEHEMADIFWHRCPNQLMTALVMSAFLKKKAKVEYKEIKRRLGAELMNMSKSFEERARYILDKMYDNNERDETQVDDDNEEFSTEEIFTEEPLDEEFRILTDKVNVMGLECTPLEFAFNNERLDFLSHSTCQRYLHTVWISGNKKIRSRFGSIRKHMVAPRTSFYVNYFFFLLAIICCSVFTLTDVRLINSFSEISNYQIAFTIWLLGDFTEEFIVELFLEKFKSQVQSTFIRIKSWMRDLWNWLDIGCYISYGFGVFSHFLSTDPEMKITRRLYTLTVVFMYVRFLRIMLTSRHIGTKVIMIAYMTKDLLNFFRILAIVIIGVGVGYHANVYPNFSPLFYDDWGDRWTDARIFSIIAMPYWQIYGDPMLEQLEDDAISYCQSQNITSDCKMDFSVSLTSFLFMMFGNILLLNLVIAMFSNRFEEVEKNSEKVWNFRYMSIVMEYRMRLPSPINFFIRPLKILFCPFQNKNIFRTRKIGIIENNYLITRKEFKYQNVTPDGIDNSTSIFQFLVKTDGDIYVGLFGYPPDKKEGEMIEILIQRDNPNTPVITNKKKDILDTKDTEGILNDSKFMEFEISWKNGKMFVYSRTYEKVADNVFCLYRKLIMTASYTIEKINYISYHTSDKSAGVWKFCNNTDKRKLNEVKKRKKDLQKEEEMKKKKKDLAKENDNDTRKLNEMKKKKKDLAKENDNDTRKPNEMKKKKNDLPKENDNDTSKPNEKEQTEKDSPKQNYNLNDVEKMKRDLPVEKYILHEVKSIQEVENCFKDESSTPKEIGYKFAKNFQTEGTNAIFRVKATCDVNLELYWHEKFDEEKESLKSFVQKKFDMMKVVIGESNSKSWISYTNFAEVCIDPVNKEQQAKTGKNNKASSNTESSISNTNVTKDPVNNINNKPKPFWFWISWGEMKEEKQVLKIGNGYEVDLDVIMEAKLDPFKVDFVGVTTSEQHQGNWIFDNGITIYTPEEFNYKLVSPVMLEQRKTITFQVKAKCDAHIALCHKLPNRCGGNMYEIVLGAKETKTSYIRNLSHEPPTILDETSDVLLDEKNYKTFWISWADGQIQVGETSLYHDELLSFDYGYEYPVLYIAVSTGPESNGYWKFDDHIIFQGIKKLESREQSNIPSNLKKMEKPRRKIWEYDYDEVKKKRVKVKWRRSQEHFSAQYIHSMNNETSINK